MIIYAITTNYNRREEKQMASEKKESEIQIDLGRIFTFIWHKIWIVIICLVVGAGVGLTATLVTKKDVYSASAIYVVYYEGGTVSDSLTAQTQVSKVLGGCVKVVEQNRFARKVVQKVNEEYGYKLVEDDIYENITYSYSADSVNTITITSQSRDPEQAYNTLSVIVELFEDYVKEQYKVADNASLVFSQINDIEQPVKPETNKSIAIFTVVGALAATLISMLVLAIIVITDQRVKSEEDLVDKYGIAVLGSVPNFEDKDLENGGEY